MRLFQATERLGAFDAVMAATALKAHADVLLSADSAFAEVAGLKFVNVSDEKAMARLGL